MSPIASERVMVRRCSHIARNCISSFAVKKCALTAFEDAADFCADLSILKSAASVADRRQALGILALLIAA
jgi:hypothetical protein